MKVAVCGGGGFIGNHLVSDLKKQGHYVVVADLQKPQYEMQSEADEFHIMDLRISENVKQLITSDVDLVFQLAADMGGAGYIFTGEHDADIVTNSALINLNVLQAMVSAGVKKVFYSSSACMYPEHNQLDPENPDLSEHSAYPANPDSEYGWEKLFSERLYLTYAKNYNLDVRVVRFHNVFGPYGSWNNGKEKSPAALCRKVATAQDGETIEVWGTGEQTRSFLYIDECIEGINRITRSNFTGPVNLGSERMISINDLAKLIARIAGKNQILIKNIPGPVGVQGRRSDNTLIREKIGWAPEENLEHGLNITYNWISKKCKHL